MRELLVARRAEAEVRGVRVMPTLAPAALRGDPRLVERLVANVLDNALRHNVPGGAVVVRTEARAGSGRLWIANDGLVVDPGQIDRLYEPFERLGAERTNAGEGFGLGLSIVKAIAAAHGATLTITARPAGGLEVEVVFPAEPVPTSSARAASTAPGGNGETATARGEDAVPPAGSGPAEPGGGLHILRPIVLQSSPPEH